MNTLMEPLADLAGGSALMAFLVFVRVGAAMALLPAFGEQSIPRTVRLVIAIMFTLIVFPAVTPAVTPTGTAGFLAAMLAETVTGLMLGAVLRMFVLALQTAGILAAQSVSLAQMFAGFGSEPMPALSQLFVIGGLALAVISGLHVSLAAYLIGSYEVLPLGILPDDVRVQSWALAQISATFALAFRLAAPFVIASLIYNLALGVVNRAMPQLMVSMIGAPAMTAGALVLAVLAVPYGLSIWNDAVTSFLASPFGAAR